MSEWAKKRTCEKCGRIFSLSDHGHEGARAAAEALGRGGGYDSRADYISVSNCPECHKKAVSNIVLKEILRQQSEKSKGKKWWQFWK